MCCDVRTFQGACKNNVGWLNVVVVIYIGWLNDGGSDSIEA
jgi:hypothetical protein